MSGLFDFLLALPQAAMANDAEHKAFDTNYEQMRRARLGADMNAVDALQQGGIAAGQQRMRGSQVIGAQKAAYAASGVDVSSGTPAEQQASTALTAELNAQNAENNAVRQALGYRRTADQYGLQMKAASDKLNADDYANGISALSKMANGLTSFLGGM
jgi:hypothetical protein